MRSRGNRNVSATSFAVNSAFVNTTSHDAICSSFDVCIRRVRGCTHSGWCSGTRSCTIVARTPPR
jgi:hypothetical protein